MKDLADRIEEDKDFREKPNIGAVRVVNAATIKMRNWERGNGETYSSGTCAAAAAYACVKYGHCRPDTDITVKVRGGDLIVRVSDGNVTLTGNVKKIYEGTVEF